MTTNLAVAIVLTEALPLHDRRATARAAVLMDVDIATEPRAFVVLFEAKMLVVIPTTSVAASTAAPTDAPPSAAGTSSSHVLESGTVPAFAAPSATRRRRWVVIVVQVSGGRAIHGRVWGSSRGDNVMRGCCKIV
jgi:hypothetical protein